MRAQTSEENKYSYLPLNTLPLPKSIAFLEEECETEIMSELHVDKFLNFTNKDTTELFQLYRKDGMFTETIVVYVATITFLLASYLSIAFSSQNLLLCTLLSVTVISGLTILLDKISGRIMKAPGLTSCLFPYLESVFAIMVSITLGYLQFVKVRNGGCSPDPFALKLCNPSQAAFALPQDISYLVASTPLLSYTIVRGVRWSVTCLCWFLGFYFMASTMATAGLWNSLAFVILSSLVSLVALVENHKHHMVVFIGYQRQKHLFERVRTYDLKQADVKFAENSALELRHIIANVAHDLKTPLAALMCGQEILGSNNKAIETLDADKTFASETSFADKTIQSMKNTCAFMTMTINRCLDYTKASNGLKLTPKLETIDLIEALALPINCMRDMQSRIDVQVVDLPKDVCTHVITDKQWFQENILCLASNAIKFTTSSPITIRMFLEKVKRPRRRSSSDTPMLSSKARTLSLAAIISTITGSSNTSPYSSEEEESHYEVLLRVEVEDPGIGLSDEAKSKLFAPFQQAQRRAGGTGLGLFSLAKRLQALDGEYGVINRRDGQHGCCFYFSFPYKPDEAAAALSQGCEGLNPSGEKFPETEKAVEAGLSILVADDAVPVLKMTCLLLGKHGNRVSKAENGYEALKLMEVNHYDVVLMDLQMPIMDGFEAISRLRERESEVLSDSLERQVSDSSDKTDTSKTSVDSISSSGFKVFKRQQIIAMSANSDHETMQEALKAGADAFMSKPFSLGTFKERMMSLDKQL